MVKTNHIRKSLHLCIDQLGCVLKAQGDLAGAQEKLEASLAMEYELHGKDKPHPDIAAILHALGGVLEAQGDLAGAQEKLENSLAMKYELHGKDKPHPDIAATLHALRGVLSRTQTKGEILRGARLYFQAVRMFREHYASTPNARIAAQGLCMVINRIEKKDRPGPNKTCLLVPLWFWHEA